MKPTVLVAWKTTENLAPELAGLEIKPRLWLSLGLGEMVSDGCAVKYCLLCLEGAQAEAMFGINLADIPTRPTPVELTLTVKG